MNESIKVAFVSDDNYFEHMIVAIESIILHCSYNQAIDFYILDVDIDEHNKEKLIQRYLQKENLNINFVSIPIDKLNHYVLKTHVSKSAFAKVFISELINVDKIIYLDCDLIFNHDILELWEQLDDQMTLKAVYNPFYNYDNKYIGIKNDKRTFNSGVMLLNLKKLRENNASKLLIEFLDNYNDKTQLHDQAAFNAIFKDDWIELDYSWNYQVIMMVSNYTDLGITKEKYFELYKNPKIIHFTSNSKPWQFRNSHPFKKQYKVIHQRIFKKDVTEVMKIKNVLRKINEYIRYKKYYVRNRFN